MTSKYCNMYLFCLLVFINIASSKLILPPEENPIQQNILKCITDIANADFNLRRTTVVLSKDIDTDIVNQFLSKYIGTVVVETKKDGLPPEQVVVIAKSLNSFMKLLGKFKPDLKGKSLLSSGAKFLIVFLTSSKKMEHIMKIFWSYRATNIVIVTHLNNKVAMYTYFPYKNHLNCQNTEPQLMRYWKEKTMPKEMYPDKMGNMKGCPMYISTNKVYHQTTALKIPLQSIKRNLMRLLRNVINFTSIISVRDYVSIDSDQAKNWSYSLNDVISGIANISTCSIPLGIDRLGLLDYSYPYFRVRLTWMAPPITTGPVYWRLLSPLNGYLWLIILLLLLFVTSLPFALKMKAVKKNCYRHFKNINKLQNVAIRIWGVLLGQPIRVAPRRFRDFYIISLWMWFTFVVRSAYQSVLIGALKTDTLIGTFTELKEAVEDGYQFGGRTGMLAHFEHDPLIHEGFEVIPEDKYEDVFREVIEGKKKFVIATSLEYAWTFCLSQGIKENECGHVLGDSLLTVPLVIWMKVYSPFKSPLAVWLPRLIESGLLEKDTIKPVPCCNSKATEATPLTHHQTLSCFICLLLGFTISMTILVLEILKHKMDQFKK